MSDASKDGPPPPDEDLAERDEMAERTAAKSAGKSETPPGAPWALIVAILWAVISVIVGLIFIFAVNAEAYGGDAYTGIEAAIVQAVHAVGWVVISTGVLGLIIAGSRVTAAK